MAKKDTTLTPYNYTLSVEFIENTVTETHKQNNVTSVTVTGILKANGTYWTTSHNSRLVLYWHDNKNNKDIQVKELSFAGLSGYVDSKTVSATFDVEHKEDGSLKGYAKLVFEKGSTSSAYAPNSGSVQTDLTALTVLPTNKKLKVKVNGVWKEAIPFIKVSGVWKEVTPYMKVNGIWKEGTR